MIRKKLCVLGMAMLMCTSHVSPVFADSNVTTMENCGAYLFTWRPVDCGNGRAFAILVGGNTIYESNVILNRGYDYAYTFNPMAYPRPWGQVPDLVNVNGVWAIPENEASLPEGIQPTTRIILKTNNKNLSTDERIVDVVHLPGNVNSSELPPEVRKYLINVDGSDAGAYNGTITAGWVSDENGKKYRKPDGTFITNGWVKVDEESYYMDPDGIMLADTITPDGIYVNAKGEKTNYIPGWTQDEKGWRYIQKNGYYAGATWVQGEDGKWYYINIGTYMETDDVTPDGYYVDANGVWDGQASTIDNTVNPGPGALSNGTWEAVDSSWKYKKEEGSYAANGWEKIDGRWYYFDSNSLMLADQTTPDGYYVSADGVWTE